MSSPLQVRWKWRCMAMSTGLLVTGVLVFGMRHHLLLHPSPLKTKTSNSTPVLTVSIVKWVPLIKDNFSVAVTEAWKGHDTKGHDTKGHDTKGQGHVFDRNLLDALVKFFRLVGTTSVLELGAGMGLYSKGIQAKGIFVSCYDGNPNTQNLTEGLCAVLDLSKPLHLSRHDWVLSLEVGEQVPESFEESFLDNVDRGNVKGVIISWATERQGRSSQNNTRNSSYLGAKFDDMGYHRMEEAEKALRKAASLPEFNNTLMVYKRVG